MLTSVCTFIDSLVKIGNMSDFGHETLQSRKQQAIEELIEKNLRMIEEHKDYLVKAYKHFVDEIISEDEYAMFKADFNQQVDDGEKNIAALREELHEFSNGERGLAMIKHFQRYENITELDRAAVVTMISSITVNDSKNLTIQFRYMNEFDALVLNSLSETERMVG